MIQRLTYKQRALSSDYVNIRGLSEEELVLLEDTLSDILLLGGEDLVGEIDQFVYTGNSRRILEELYSEIRKSIGLQVPGCETEDLFSRVGFKFFRRGVTTRDNSPVKELSNAFKLAGLHASPSITFPPEFTSLTSCGVGESSESDVASATSYFPHQVQTIMMEMEEKESDDEETKGGPVFK